MAWKDAPAGTALQRLVSPWFVLRMDPHVFSEICRQSPLTHDAIGGIVEAEQNTAYGAIQIDLRAVAAPHYANRFLAHPKDTPLNDTCNRDQLHRALAPQKSSTPLSLQAGEGDFNKSDANSSHSHNALFAESAQSLAYEAQAVSASAVFLQHEIRFSEFVNEGAFLEVIFALPQQNYTPSFSQWVSIEPAYSVTSFDADLLGNLNLPDEQALWDEGVLLQEFELSSNIVQSADWQQANPADAQGVPTSGMLEAMHESYLVGSPGVSGDASGAAPPISLSEWGLVNVPRPAVVPLSVDSFLTAGRDDADAIEAALAALESAGGGVLMFSARTYILSRTVDVPSDVILVGNGAKLTWPETGSPYSFFRVENASRVAIEDFTFEWRTRDQPATTDHTHAVVISSSSQVEVTGNSFSGTKAINIIGSHGVKIFNNDILRGAEGIVIGVLHGNEIPGSQMSRNIVIQDNYFQRQVREAIDLNGNAENVFILRNTFVGGSFSRSAVEVDELVDIGGGVMRNITVDGNTFDGAGNYAAGIRAKLGTQALTITNNIFTNFVAHSTTAVLDFLNVDAKIRDNVISAPGSAFLFRGKNSGEVAGNQIDSRSGEFFKSTGSALSGVLIASNQLTTGTVLDVAVSINEIAFGSRISYGKIWSETAYGGLGADLLYGGGGNDQLFGQGGNDTILGGIGNDTLNGGLGNDYLSGDFDNDVLAGGAGADTLEGAAGRDTLSGQDGDDLLLGGEDNDSLDGGADADRLIGGAGNDTCRGGLGNDYISGDLDNDLLLGEDGADTLEGGAGRDSLSGHNGNDLLGGGGDNDSLDGGAGADTLIGDAGNDSCRGGAANDHAFGGQGDDVLMGEDGLDTLEGGGGKDSLSGHEGNDLLLGGEDVDTLDGGMGADTLMGGQGNDVFFFRILTESPSNTPDVIFDFQQGDLISLSTIDANPLLAGNQAFRFIGDANFSGSTAEVRFWEVDGLTAIGVNLPGDVSPDMIIMLQGIYALRATDFAL